MNTSLQEVLKTSLTHDGLVKGLHQAAKALDKYVFTIIFCLGFIFLTIFLFIKNILSRREALLCVMALNCDEPAYTKLVEALCAEHNIDLIKVEDNKKLGEWAGMCKIDKEGKARKVVGCSCVVVKDWVEETPGLNFLRQYLSERKNKA